MIISYCRTHSYSAWLFRLQSLIWGLAGTAIAAAVGLACPTPVFAADQMLEEVIVTARYKEEKLQETPLAITAISGELLEARNLTDTTQIDTFSPNTVIQPLGAGWGSTAAAFIRGIGLGDNSLSFEPGVPIYIDDVYFGRPQGAILDLLDLERVEILRGPQGTLFGKNAIGGTVRLISKKPQGDNSGYVEGTYGKFDRLNVRGSYDVSIVPNKLFARFSASSKKRDGYFKILDFECVNGPGSLGNGGTGIPVGATHNTFGFPLPLNLPAGSVPPAGLAVNPVTLGSVLGPMDVRAADNGCTVDRLGDEDVVSTRAAFRWLASDDVEVNFNADWMQIDQKGPADKFTIFVPSHFFNASSNQNVMVPVFGVPWDNRFKTDSLYTNYERWGSDPLTHHDIQNVNDMEHWGFSGVIDWNVMENIHAKSITAYRDFVNTFGRDSDGTPLPIDHTWDTSKHDQFTQEVQVTGLSFDSRLDWVVGGFYYKANDSNQGWNFLYPFILSTNNHKDTQDIKNWAVFFHGTVHVTDKLDFTGGIRYTEDDKTAHIFRQDFITGNVIIPNAVVAVKANQWSPKAGFSYQWTDDLMSYFQWSTGFRGGGFGPRPADIEQVEQGGFGVEELETYEVGAKSDWMDKRLRVNADWFWSIYSNQQQFIQQFDSTGAIWFRTTNTGESRYWGVEVEVQAEPIDKWLLEGSMGYTNFRRTDPGSTFLCTELPNGDNCPSARTPEWNAAIGSQYTWTLGGNAGSLTLRGDMSYMSRIFFSPDDPVHGFQGGYSLLDARATWDSPDQAWSVVVYGTNLTDRGYFNGKLSLVGVLGREQGNPAAPREWGITVRRSF